jgi:hypothetical protein
MSITSREARGLLLGVLSMALLWSCQGATPKETPAKQPLTMLTKDNFAAFQERFNATSDTTRVIAMLSPT